MAPIWDNLASKTKVNVAKVDCTVEKQVMTRFGVRGFPTIKFLKDGKLYDYRGQRTVEGFVAFADGGGYAATTPTEIPRGAEAKKAEAGKDEL